MSIVIDRPAALVALPRERALTPGDGARRAACDVEPRVLTGAEMPAAPVAATWRLAASTGRGFGSAGRPTAPSSAPRIDQDGRVAFDGTAYVAFTKHTSTRSGPPSDRPPA